jgi:isoquinoline 1-oxidoreductase alpha subunit
MGTDVVRTNFVLNGQPVAAEHDPELPLLWYLRDHAGLTGTKYGCGIVQCGACTVHVDGAPTRACVTPLAQVADRTITTIEGLDGQVGTAVQAAWRALDVVQCGYCQSGQIMAASALLSRNTQPSRADIDAALAGNLCRCATYHRIRAAVEQAAAALAKT